MALYIFLIVLRHVVRVVVFVPFSDDQIEGEIDNADDGKQPIEAVQVSDVWIAAYPTLGSGRLGESVDGVDKYAAEVEPEGQRTQADGGSHRPHGQRRLVVEELELTDVRECFTGSDQKVLRQ